MKKNRILSLALASALCFSLAAGCSSSGNGAAGQPSANPGGTPAAQPQSSGAPASGETIKVGLLANTTGAAAQYGIAVSQGALLYIDQVNADGGINGKQIEIIQYDDKGEPTEAISLFNRMVGENVTAFIGSVLTGPTIAVADEAFPINMPMISASATAAGVTIMEDTGEVRTNVFRSCFIDPFQGEKMAQYAAEKLSAKTAAVIYDTGNDYCAGLAEAFIAKCAELNIEVVAEEGYATGDKAFQAQLTTIAGKNPDVVFAPNYYEDIGLIVTQARDVGVTSTFLGGDGWAGVKDYASAEALEGSIYCSGYGFGADPEFEAAYEAKYGAPITGMFEALGYDAALLMVNALQGAEDKGLTAGTDEYKQAVIDTMKATSGLKGLTGTFAFDENNDPIKSASMIEVKGGAEVFKEIF